MNHPTRREFLVSTASAVAVGTVLGSLARPAQGAEFAARRRPTASAGTAIPPHRALPVPGVHLYTDKPNYSAGDTLTGYVSASESCEIEVARLGEEIDGPDRDEVLHTQRLPQSDQQPIHPGSYIHIAKGLAATPLAALTLECWVRLWNVHEPQGLITQLEDAAGMGLIVFPDGAIAFFTGECADPAATPHRSETSLTVPGKPTFSGYVTPPANWHYVAAVFDGKHKTLWIDGRPAGQWEWTRPVTPANGPLRLGALGRGGEAAGMLDADIALPAVRARALREVEIRTRHAERGLAPVAREPGLAACWPLAEERGATVRDISGHDRTGTIVNHGTWMVGGPSFLPAMARYRRDYVPADDATRGHGLRLASDDLVDCRWRPTFSHVLPRDAKPGLYVLRARFMVNGETRMTHAPFVVRQHRDSPRPAIVLLFATNTWKAYSGAPFAPAWPGVLANIGIKGYQPKADDPLAPYNFYRFHRAGQPAYHLGWRMPWPTASPYALYSPPEVGYSHATRADRFTQRWLESEGYRYDALSDLDLHRDERALDGAKVLVIAGHSEYWSREAMQRVRAFLDRGGNVVCLSGNTMYWRVTYSDDDSTIECRKADAWGAQLADYMVGECWHAQDQRRGGVPRDSDDPAWRTLGVEFAAAKAVRPNALGAFEVTDVAHPFFHEPHPTGLAPGERFGFDPQQPTRHPIGHESDVLLSTLMGFTRRMPPLAGLPGDLRDPDGIWRLAVGRVGVDLPWGEVRDYAHRIVPKSELRADDSLCDMIHWRRPAGGQVFAAPSISAGWTLAVCPKWSRLLKNVLHHFGVPSA